MDQINEHSYNSFSIFHDDVFDGVAKRNKLLSFFLYLSIIEDQENRKIYSKMVLCVCVGVLNFLCGFSFVKALVVLIAVLKQLTRQKKLIQRLNLQKISQSKGQNVEPHSSQRGQTRTVTCKCNYYIGLSQKLGKGLTSGNAAFPLAPY